MAPIGVRIPLSEVLDWHEKYEFLGDEELVDMAEGIRARGMLSKDELLRVVDWKSARRRRLVADCDAVFISEASRLALGAEREELRIGILTLIPGVGFPTASVVLHFFHADRYPIIDFRALWSLGLAVPAQYTFPFWREYVRICRQLADECAVTMRELDRALWQFSKEHQQP